ncbi:predicted protein [Sclerotinia sclerotiorum 1980 UF-70]|uniref:Uncharacterized protein n=1 Tax=Sclerotinia sclerotiorum (strain ATCC 18683 / 1980 / Ss-1) TaxID=665079 RepID=A7E5Q1_SCLS1|nr:predicted protein [Sclerotinia sclerotiorum 1980 UF-70]EDN91223.1 predicted protein [Sclerotinia sclerotiorum 1980 UF-70]
MSVCVWHIKYQIYRLPNESERFDAATVFDTTFLNGCSASDSSSKYGSEMKGCCSQEPIPVRRVRKWVQREESLLRNRKSFDIRMREAMKFKRWLIGNSRMSQDKKS